jgi:hypothetical protein
LSSLTSSEVASRAVSPRGQRPSHRTGPPPETGYSGKHLPLSLLDTVSLVLIFDQLKALVAAVKGQVPQGAATKDASRLLECEERDQRDEEDGGVSYEAGQ